MSAMCYLCEPVSFSAKWNNNSTHLVRVEIMHVQHLAHNKYYMDSSCLWKTSYWVSNWWVGKVSFVLLFDVLHQKSGRKYMQLSHSLNHPTPIKCEAQYKVLSKTEAWPWGAYYCSELGSAFTRHSYISGQGPALGWEEGTPR